MHSNAGSGPTDEQMGDVAKLYWKELGREPDQSGWIHHANLLAAGASLEEVAQGMRNSTEAASRLVRDHEVWSDDNVGDTPYVVQPRSGASYLLVTCAGIGYGASAPSFELMPAGVPAHRLAIGMGANRPLDVPELRQWADAIGRLVRSTAQGFGVPPERTICAGHSYHATFAAIIGLTVGSGHLILGAPPLRLGTWATRLYESTRNPLLGKAPLFEYLYEGARLQEPGSDASNLDNFLFDLARESKYEASLRLLVSKSDSFYPEVAEFVDEVASNNALDVRLVLADYGTHDDLIEPFYTYASEYVQTLARKAG
jgi:hypothetical protein